MDEAFLRSALSPPQAPPPAQQALPSVTHAWARPPAPVRQLHREEASSTLFEVSLLFFFLTFPTFFSLPTTPHSPSPAQLHTSLVVNDTITSSLHPQLTGIELREPVTTLPCVLPEWVGGNALPNINEANQTAAAATVSLHIYIYIDL